MFNVAKILLHVDEQKIAGKTEKNVIQHSIKRSNRELSVHSLSTILCCFLVSWVSYRHLLLTED